MDKTEARKMQQYTCHDNIEFGSLQDAFSKVMKEHTIKCPECLKNVHQEELDMFGGLCEECSGAFND